MCYNYGNTLMFYSNITIKIYNFHIKVSFLLWVLYAKAKSTQEIKKSPIINRYFNKAKNAQIKTLCFFSC